MTEREEQLAAREKAVAQREKICDWREMNEAEYTAWVRGRLDEIAKREHAVENERYHLEAWCRRIVEFVGSAPPPMESSPPPPSPPVEEKQEAKQRPPRPCLITPPPPLPARMR